MLDLYLKLWYRALFQRVLSITFTQWTYTGAPSAWQAIDEGIDSINLTDYIDCTNGNGDLARFGVDYPVLTEDEQEYEFSLKIHATEGGAGSVHSVIQVGMRFHSQNGYFYPAFANGGVINQGGGTTTYELVRCGWQNNHRPHPGEVFDMAEISIDQTNWGTAWKARVYTVEAYMYKGCSDPSVTL
jgi:hypothetical protein